MANPNPPTGTTDPFGMEQSSERAKAYYEASEAARIAKKQAEGERSTQEHSNALQSEATAREQIAQQEEWLKQEKKKREEIEADKKRHEAERLRMEEELEKKKVAEKKRVEYMKDLSEMGRMKAVAKKRKYDTDFLRADLLRTADQEERAARLQAERTLRDAIIAIDDIDKRKRLMIENEKKRRYTEAQIMYERKVKELAEEQHAKTLVIEEEERSAVTDISRAKHPPEVERKMKIDVSVQAHQKRAILEREIAAKRSKLESDLRSEKQRIDNETVAQITASENEARRAKAEAETAERQAIHQAETIAVQKRSEARRAEPPL